MVVEMRSCSEYLTLFFFFSFCDLTPCIQTVLTVGETESGFYDHALIRSLDVVFSSPSPSSKSHTVAWFVLFKSQVERGRSEEAEGGKKQLINTLIKEEHQPPTTPTQSPSIVLKQPCTRYYRQLQTESVSVESQSSLDQR